MKLSHFTNKPLTCVTDSVQPTLEYISPYQKPYGFWVSVDGEDDWLSWCTSETDWIDTSTLRYRIALTDDASILKMPDDLSLEDFQDSFGVGTKFRDKAIDWHRVAELYDGIIIAPYQWQHRLSMSWYHPWDCASGVIWLSKAIKDVRLIAPPTIVPVRSSPR